ncbi:MAG: thrombospondin type 3 repeat-containing protein, partial [Myxococcota bacterium]
LFLDIKAIPYVPDIVQALQDFGFPTDDIWVWDRFGTGLPFNALMPEAHTVGSPSPPVDLEMQIINFVQRGWSGVTSGHRDVDREFIDLAHSYGLLVMTATVQSPFFQKQIDLGVDIVVASAPALLAPLIPGTPNACDDGLDGDGDGLIDHPDDPGCFGPGDRSEEDPCSDGIDNDGDGDIDFPADAGCFAAYSSTENPQCSDGVDNNDDGNLDYPNDVGCLAVFDQHELSSCLDGQDNDGDGLIDYPDDPDCKFSWWSETITECNDGLDNDADGLGDFPEDPSCSSRSDDWEGGPAASEDKDGDGIIDVDDNCETMPNVDQANFDGDEWGDACDADDDEDGVFDPEDNCWPLQNPGQADTDQDGYGNLCDSDFDGSGFVDGVDFFLHFLPAFASGEDTGVGTDMNGDGIVDGIDFATGFIPQFIRGRPGPSGRDCAGAPPCS